MSLTLLGVSVNIGHARRLSQVALKQSSSSSTYKRPAPAPWEERQREEDQNSSVPLGTRKPRSAFGKDKQRAWIDPHLTSTDYAAMREPNPEFAEHLNGLFPELQFPQEFARRILTHASHPAAIYGHNAAFSFLGRRVLSTYLYLLLSSSPNLKPTDNIEEIVSSALNTYVLGEHVGSYWGLGRKIRWTPAVTAETARNIQGANLLKSVGLYKIQGDTVAAVVGGIYEQFGGSVAHRLFHTRILPRLVSAAPGKQNLPTAFHQDVRVVCNRMGGTKGPLLKKEDGHELESPLKKPAAPQRKEKVETQRAESSPEQSVESIA
ncbi:hypothetical protein D9758_003020 [Tetrapyrgos nigripes]|uniref:RNase III domain-containing protein n=1 Tax=Tetrapyrgos nigripes TaxID=182062 RepID=A0A8H5GQ61_9AGAR|nr:hypothetical protein D9758_003020 [Tetrapyrgos nigripes]